jgi:DNA-binding MarR family transcriptional regulator
MVLDLIRFTPEGISRVELARQMYLKRSAISNIIDELNRTGLIDLMKIGNTTRGRWPILLSINPKFGYVVEIDMGRLAWESW